MQDKDNKILFRQAVFAAADWQLQFTSYLLHSIQFVHVKAVQNIKQETNQLQPAMSFELD